MGKVESGTEESRIGTNDVYSALAAAILGLHLLFILWILFGATITRRRPLLRGLHLGSLVWGILIEILPWTCPLTWGSGGYCAVPGWIPAALSRRIGLPEHSTRLAHRPWSRGLYH